MRRLNFSSTFPMGLLSSTTLDALQQAADRKRDRERVQRSRDRKPSAPYGLRLKKGV